MKDLDLAESIHRAAFLRDINSADDLARLARVPTSVVLDALRSGTLPGREFPGLGWRVTKRAALLWLEHGKSSAPNERGLEGDIAVSGPPTGQRSAFDEPHGSGRADRQVKP